jgi:hypothetical protein
VTESAGGLGPAGIAAGVVRSTRVPAAMNIDRAVKSLLPFGW